MEHPVIVITDNRIGNRPRPVHFAPILPSRKFFDN